LMSYFCLNGDSWGATLVKLTTFHFPPCFCRT
jgi:hypothetical protein